MPTLREKILTALDDNYLTAEAKIEAIRVFVSIPDEPVFEPQNPQWDITRAVRAAHEAGCARMVFQGKRYAIRSATCWVESEA